MKKRSLIGVAALLAAIVLAPGIALAQDSYHIGENTPAAGASADAPANPSSDAADTQGPVRLARFSYVDGNVTWRPDDQSPWTAAQDNQPLREGAQVWVADGGHAVVQFDDGSVLRLGSGAVVTVETLYSDQNGEFTELKMSEGLATLRLTHARSIYQIDTPFVSIKSDGPSQVRVGVNDTVEIAVRKGTATIDGAAGKDVLQEGSYLDLDSADSPYDVGPLPQPDSWDQWNDERDAALAQSQQDPYLPSDIALVAGNLDDYGVWREDPEYGRVWCPRTDYSNWRPYEYGHWVWVDPFGWTWVSDEPWGWAPYHYGTWIHASYGWGWCPGPVHQYWCPAVVSFSYYDGSVCWAPLGPGEVRYPASISIGFGGGDWSLFFSIGGCATYYAAGFGYCDPRPWGNYYVNRYSYGHPLRYSDFGHGIGTDHFHFVPSSANHGGLTYASASNFGGRGDFHAGPEHGASYFSNGSESDARADGHPFSGPANVHPAADSFSASRDVAAGHPQEAYLNRSVTRASLPPRVAHVAPQMSHAEDSSRTANSASHEDTGRSAEQSSASSRDRDEANQAREDMGGYHGFTPDRGGQSEGSEHGNGNAPGASEHQASGGGENQSHSFSNSGGAGGNSHSFSNSGGGRSYHYSEAAPSEERTGGGSFGGGDHGGGGGGGDHGGGGGDRGR